MTPPWSALQVSWAIASLCSFSQALLEFTNVETGYTYNCHVLSICESFVCYWNTPALQRRVSFCHRAVRISSAYTRIPPLVSLAAPRPTALGHHPAPSPAPWATEQLPASSLFDTWWCTDVSATLSVHTQLTEIKPLALEGKRRARQWCWGIASLERHKRDCNTCSLWGTREAEKQNFHCIIYCIFWSFKFCAWQVLFFCATVQYMYKDIHRPTQTHTKTYTGMKKSSAVYVGLTLQIDAGVSKCGTLAACLAKSCFWPFSHSGWSTLRPHQLYPWMGAFLFHQKSGKSFYSYCLLGHAKRDKTGNWGKKKKKSMITPVFLPGKSHGQRSLAGWIARSRIQLSKHTHTFMNLEDQTWSCGNLIQHPYFHKSK